MNWAGAVILVCTAYMLGAMLADSEKEKLIKRNIIKARTEIGRRLKYS